MAKKMKPELLEALNDFISNTSYHERRYDADLDVPVDCDCEFCEVRAKAIEVVNKYQENNS
jgi:hypothetical protein